MTATAVAKTPEADTENIDERSANLDASPLYTDGVPADLEAANPLASAVVPDGVSENLDADAEGLNIDPKVQAIVDRAEKDVADPDSKYAAEIEEAKNKAKKEKESAALAFLGRARDRVFNYADAFFAAFYGSLTDHIGSQKKPWEMNNLTGHLPKAGETNAAAKGQVKKTNSDQPAEQPTAETEDKKEASETLAVDKEEKEDGLTESVEAWGSVWKASVKAGAPSESLELAMRVFLTPTTAEFSLKNKTDALQKLNEKIEDYASYVTSGSSSTASVNPRQDRSEADKLFKAELQSVVNDAEIIGKDKGQVQLVLKVIGPVLEKVRELHKADTPAKREAIDNIEDAAGEFSMNLLRAKVASDQIGAARKFVSKVIDISKETT